MNNVLGQIKFEMKLLAFDDMNEASKASSFIVKKLNWVGTIRKTKNKTCISGCKRFHDPYL